MNSFYELKMIVPRSEVGLEFFSHTGTQTKKKANRDGSFQPAKQCPAVKKRKPVLDSVSIRSWAKLGAGLEKEEVGQGWRRGGKEVERLETGYQRLITKK